MVICHPKSLPKPLLPDQDLNRDGETDVSGLDYQAHLRLLRLNKADSLGIITSDNMVKARLEQMFTNPNDKKFSTQNYNNFLNQYRGGGFLPGGDAGEAQFQELIREQITFQQMDELMTRSVGFFSDQATVAQQVEENKKYTTQTVFFTTSNRVSEVTNFTTIATNYYQKVSDQYFVQPKRKVAYVLFPVAPYLDDAEKQIKLDDLVKERIAQHLSSTNKIDHLTDANGTKLEAGAKLDKAALENVRESNQARLNEITLPKAKKVATEFRKLIFEGTETEKGKLTQRDWSIERLRDKSKKQNLAVSSVTVDQSNEESSLPQTLVDALYELPDSAAGMLSTSAVEVPEKGYYVFGLEQIIAGHTREYEKLSKDEQAEVKKGFIEMEVKRLASDEGGDWREAVTESMAEGVSFGNTIKLSKHIIVNLPSMTVTEQDVNATTLKGLATVSEIQSVIGNLERENRSAAEPNWLSSYNTSSTEGVGGFIVYVSKVEEGDFPTDPELEEFANSQRQLARNFNSSFTAARFGITPAWLRADVKVLDSQLLMEGLLSSLINLPYQYETTLKEYQDLDNTIRQVNTGQIKLPSNMTIEDLTRDYNDARDVLIKKRSDNAYRLPHELREANQNYLLLTSIEKYSDNDKHSEKVDDAIEKADEFDLELLIKEIEQNPERILTAIEDATEKHKAINNQLTELRKDPKKTTSPEIRNLLADSGRVKARLKKLKELSAKANKK